MTVPLYFDHNMQFAVVTALRERGIDVLTTREDGYDRHPDDQVLVRAQKLARVVVTHDQDFLELATECIATSTDFPGIDCRRIHLRRVEESGRLGAPVISPNSNPIFPKTCSAS